MNEMSEAETMTEPSHGVKKIYFFIGRTTPPHSGHIHVLQKMIEKAKASKTPALILLGNGPNKGQRTKENPVEHETKAAFIREKLAELGYHEGIDYVLELMIQPPNKQIVDFVSSFITGTTTSVDIIQVAGKKGLIQGEGATAAGKIEYEDLEKHSFVRNNACKTLRLKLNYKHITFDCDNVQGIDALTGSGPIGEMSATKVRNAAVDCFSKHSENMEEAFRCWLERFPYYNSKNTKILELSNDIFEQIIKYKDIDVSTSSRAKTARASASASSESRHTKSQSARKSPSPKGRRRESSRSPSPRGNGKGGSRRSRNIRFRRRSKSVMLHNKTKHNRKK